MRDACLLRWTNESHLTRNYMTSATLPFPPRAGVMTTAGEPLFTF